MLGPTRMKVGRRRRARGNNSYEKMMKTLLLQNQQIIIQQQNMMFMVMKQYQQSSPPTSTNGNPNQQQHDANNNNHHQHNHQQTQSQQPQNNNIAQLSQQHHHQQQQQQQQYHRIHDEHSHQLFSQANLSSTAGQTIDTQHQLQQVETQLPESLHNYLTPAASEQSPNKPEEDDLATLLEGDGLLHNNLLYNPQTDIGSVTPYKNQQQTPSYYSSGCESLSTPRLEQRQPMTSNISQTVVKNLADSFKSPSKPKINVQILSGSATGSKMNSKAKIIQRMNISEFLRHVHPDTDEPQMKASQ